MARVDIIIPVYQPGKDWAFHLNHELSNGLNTSHFYSLIIVNDGGQGMSMHDMNIIQMLEDFSHIKEVKILEYENNKGKGYAIRTGIHSSSNSLIIYTDDDIPYGVDSINAMVERLADDVEVILPDRGRDYFRSLPFKRMIISKGLIWMNRIFMGLKHPDTQAGLKGFNRKVAKLILEGQENGFLFEVEWIQKSVKAGISIVTTPVKIKDEIIPSGIPGGDIWKLLKAYFRLFRSR